MGAYTGTKREIPCQNLKALSNHYAPSEPAWPLQIEHIDVVRWCGDGAVGDPDMTVYPPQ